MTGERRQVRATTAVNPLGDQDTDRLTRLRVVVGDEAPSDAARLIEGFASRYTNPKTARQYRADLTALFSNAGVVHRGCIAFAAVAPPAGEPALPSGRTSRWAVRL
jgi:hypothetical protein